VIDRLPYLWPEIALFVTTCVVMVIGLSRSLATRKLTAVVAGLGVVVAGVLAALVTPTGAELAALPHPERAGQLLMPDMVPYVKCMIAAVGLMLLLALEGTVDREDEELIASGRARFDPLRSNRAEFYAFYLFSLTGLMLCAGADDLIWLFLALELTSLPTYIMVAISTPRLRGREAAVKYFFLGALGAAVFLYGFALIYGGTGTTNLNKIHEVFTNDGINGIAMAGILLSILGLCFKIAAVPMHFYTPDVYQGAAPQVSGFLAFVPKTAGFIAILLLCATFGWRYVPEAGSMLASTTRISSVGTELPEVVRLMLWIIAALTMLVGNVLALMQTSVKRILAYSSVAHSGYIIVGIIAGPGNGSFTQSGIAAVLFYLLCYGVMNVGTFAVLAAIERKPGADGIVREVENVSDLRGLCGRHPALGWSMVICSLSLLGLPPLLGFFGKLPLFTSAIASDELPLVIWMGINSSIAAFYYLRLAFAPLTEKTDPDAEETRLSPFRGRTIAAVVSAGGVITVSMFGMFVIESATDAGRYTPGVKSLPTKNAADEVKNQVKIGGQDGGQDGLKESATSANQPMEIVPMGLKGQ